MQKRRIINCIIVGVLCVVAFLWYKKPVWPLPNDALAHVQSLHVEDDFSEDEEFSRVTVTATFIHQGDTWNGTANVSPLYEKDNNGHRTLLFPGKIYATSFPDAKMQKIIGSLQGIPIRFGSVVENNNNVQDGSTRVLTFQSAGQAVTFQNKFETIDTLPWIVYYHGLVFVTDSRAPETAQEHLFYYMHEEDLIFRLNKAYNRRHPIRYM